MKIEELTIQNLRNVKDKDISFKNDINVIIGENGSGKSTILLSIVSVLTNLNSIYGGVKFTSDDLSKHTDSCFMKIKLKLNEYETEYLGLEKSNSEILLNYHLNNKNQTLIIVDKSDLNKVKKFAKSLDNDDFYGGAVYYFDSFRFLPSVIIEGPNSNVTYKNIREYALSSSIEKSEPNNNEFFINNKYTNIKQWLINLEFACLKDPNEYNKNLFNSVISSINDLFHPFTFHKITSKGDVLFNDGIGTKDINKLSDGFKNLFIILGELFYRTTMVPNDNYLLFQNEGIVLIDEIDCHIHPKWQARILQHLTKTFPNMQFIVTTHSPFIIHDIDDEKIIELTGVDLDE